VRLCATCSGGELVATYFEDPDSRQRFHALELDRAVCVRVGVHDGEPRHRGVWMWNQGREGDLALAHFSPTVGPCLEAALSAAQEFIECSSLRFPHSDRTGRMDLPPLLAPIG